MTVTRASKKQDPAGATSKAGDKDGDAYHPDGRRKGEPKRTPKEVQEDEVLRALVRKQPELDRQIVEGMLQDRTGLMECMDKLGVTAGAVLRRSAELGLSEALLRQVRGVAADLAGDRPTRPGAPSGLGARTCLSCDRIFFSTGRGNRLCMRCRGGDAGLAQA